MNNSNMLDVALQYVRAGFRVLPVTPGQKAPPLLVAWQDRAASDHLTIKRWWERWPNANPAIRCGRYGDNHYLTVIDVDEYKGGARWLLLNRELFVPTHVALSGSGQGKQFYYWTRTPHRNSVDQIAVGVDVRGEGGYVLVPGALHPSGGYYKVGCSLPIAQMPDMLDWAISPPTPPEPVAYVPPAAPDARPTPEVLLKWALAQVRVGNRDDMGFKLAKQVIANGYLGLDGERIMREYARRVPSGGSNNQYTEADAMRNWFSALKYPALAPWPDKSNKPQGGA